jgi:hypothetical protein
VRAVRTAVLAVVALAAAAALGVGAAAAADECRGLQVCLPLEGPWVVIQPAAAGGVPRADWALTCPRRGYIVAGTDVRIGDRRVDVGIRGETGSPVAPGTTTRESVLFSGLYAGGDRRAVAFRPFIGCIPTSGGGARNQTARTATPRDGLKPTQPVTRSVGERKLGRGATTVTARCPAGSQLVDWGQDIAFNAADVPSDAVLASVTSSGRVVGGTLRVTAVVKLRTACTRTGK